MVVMVIDFMNMLRYYDVSDFEKYGVRVYKIWCAGRDGASASREVSEFVYVV